MTHCSNRTPLFYRMRKDAPITIEVDDEENPTPKEDTTVDGNKVIYTPKLERNVPSIYGSLDDLNAFSHPDIHCMEYMDGVTPEESHKAATKNGLRSPARCRSETLKSACESPLVQKAETEETKVK